MYGKNKLPWDQAAGFQCLSPDDTRKFYRNCRLGSPAGDLNYCVVFAEGAINCADGETRGPSQLLNWVCLDEGDSEEFLVFCKRRQGKGDGNQ